jgi:hypothetical protein
MFDDLFLIQKMILLKTIKMNFMLEPICIRIIKHQLMYNECKDYDLYEHDEPTLTIEFYYFLKISFKFIIEWARECLTYGEGVE